MPDNPSNPTDADLRLFKKAFELSRKYHGPVLDLYLPGMIRYGNLRGLYPAVSITGKKCQLLCDHCRGLLLKPMLKAETPDELLFKARHFAQTGNHGLLLTGGSDTNGQLPWEHYIPVIRQIHGETGLFLSAHTGFPDSRTCGDLRNAGVKQGLIDIMGDEETAKDVYHLPGLKTVLDAFRAIQESGLQSAPHIVAGLYHGRMKAEYEALKIIRDHDPHVLVIVVLTPLKQTPMASAKPPSSLEIARLIANARLLMPKVPISLGCERPRNRQGWEMERFALQAGINRMAVWSAHAVEEAQRLGLTLRFQRTCCSVDYCEAYASPRHLLDF